MSESPARQHRGLTQAPVTPLDQDGVQVGITGTVAWVIGAVILLVRGDASPAWWLWTCWVGIAIGLVGLVYCLRRRTRRKPQQVSST